MSMPRRFLNSTEQDLEDKLEKALIGDLFFWNERWCLKISNDEYLDKGMRMLSPFRLEQSMHEQHWKDFLQNAPKVEDDQ